MSSDCDPLYKNHSMLLNPCGLIANSLFNGTLAFSCCCTPDLSLCLLTFPSHCPVCADVITLDSTEYTLDEKGISWLSDRNVKFNNVDGFKKVNNGADSSASCIDVMGSKYAGRVIHLSEELPIMLAAVSWLYCHHPMTCAYRLQGVHRQQRRRLVLLVPRRRQSAVPARVLPHGGLSLGGRGERAFHCLDAHCWFAHVPQAVRKGGQKSQQGRSAHFQYQPQLRSEQFRWLQGYRYQ